MSELVREHVIPDNRATGILLLSNSGEFQQLLNSMLLRADLISINAVRETMDDPNPIHASGLKGMHESADIALRKAATLRIAVNAIREELANGQFLERIEI